MLETVNDPKMEQSEIVPQHDYIVAYRYNSAQRVQHLVNLILMNIFFITGLEIYMGNYPIGGYKFTQNLHVVLGLFIVYWSVYLYLVILIKEKKFGDIIPTPRDILDLCIILMCALRILPDSKYPHYDFYDPAKRKYVMKYHPTQKLLATANFVMLIFISITGFALYEQISPGTLGILGTTCMNIINPIVDLGLPLRFLHFAIFVYFFCSTSIHVYFTLLKENRGRLHGMMIGGERIYVEGKNPYERSH
ncbi:MAG: cytochrome b/b6 domain-containing protein [Candidatus Kariarchaeaceae archaeon]|jgi:cytochrome b subunit of formate dehydrogenase